MSGRQWTVLGLILAMFGLEYAFNPNTRAGVGRLFSTSWMAKGGGLDSDAQKLIFWLLGVVLLLVLADVAPTATFWLMAILLLGLALRFSAAIRSWFGNVQVTPQSGAAAAGTRAAGIGFGG